MTDVQIDIGIDEATRREIADGLSRLLADTYTLYLKTHNYHWNVTGPMFQTLHLMFEQQYNELALAVDLVAERIRALGAPAPASFHEFAGSHRDPRRRRLPGRHRDDASASRRPGDGGANGTVDLPARRESERRAHCGSPHPTDAGSREDRLDAAQPPCLNNATVGGAFSDEELFETLQRRFRQQRRVKGPKTPMHGRPQRPTAPVAVVPGVSLFSAARRSGRRSGACAKQSLH